MTKKTININDLIKIAMASALLCVGVARAQEAAPVGNKDGVAREKKQESRIDADLAAGKITPEQAQKLKAKEARIDKFREKATKDGKMSDKDSRKIRKMENKVGKKIHRAENRGVASTNGSSSAPNKMKKVHHRKGAEKPSANPSVAPAAPTAPANPAPSTPNK